MSCLARGGDIPPLRSDGSVAHDDGPDAARDWPSKPPTEGDDRLIGDTADDEIHGEEGNDTIEGRGGDDRLYGDDGNDEIRGEDGEDRLSGGDDQLYGGNGNDSLYGDAANDKLYGDAGDDKLDGGSGIDLLYGGDGNDLIRGGYDHSSDGLFGDAGDDVLRGEDGNDGLRGGDGDDVLVGGAGADKLDGGAGVDTASYADSAAGVMIDLATGGGWGGDAMGDVLVGIETVIGSAHDDVFVAGTAANRIDGGAGADRVDYSGSDAGVVLDLSGGRCSGGWAEGDVLVGIEDVVGTAQDDRITGNGAANRLLGGDGDDRLFGGDGSDRLYGEAGADVLEGGRGSDWLEGGAGADTLSGQESQDLLYGGDGDDRLDGGSDHDQLEGGAGRDVLTGGAGADGFFYYAVSDSAAGSADQITDFSQAEGDLIWLSPIDANIHTKADDEFAFIDTAAFTVGVPGQLRYQATASGDTLMQGDTNGDGVADIEIVLTGTITLEASDFLL
ncbi:calcium-binding protein [Inquilinus sp. CA228]|uniref:calcium-binding protein n=1 Tax=Inquilinus sp. CA228 TaxID=3455609 RepID=UPI003F8D4F3A